jgi:hypothetical protein
LHHPRKIDPALPFVAAEERLGRDTERELGHVGVHVACLARPVPSDEILGDPHHVIAVPVDVRLVKRRHQEAPVPLVFVAVDVEKARHHPLERPFAVTDVGTGRVEAPGERDRLKALVLGQDLAVRVGTRHEDDAGPGRGLERPPRLPRARVAHPDRRPHEGYDVPVLGEESAGAPDRVAEVLEHVAHHSQAPHRRGPRCGRYFYGHVR